MAADPFDLLSAARSRFCSQPLEVAPGLFVRCQSRRRSVCPSCSDLYRGDWDHIARAGIYTLDGTPVAGHRFYFITLSAPSFGQVHRVPSTATQRARRCACGRSHAQGDADLRGVPIDLDRYKYRQQVSWHLGLGRLWNSTVMAMRDLAPDLAFFAVREAQARMALHVHALVRVPEAQAVPAEALGRAARRATAIHPVTRRIVRWGQRGAKDSEIAPMTALAAEALPTEGAPPTESVAASRVARYVSKAVTYSLKDITPGDEASAIGASPLRLEFIRRLHAAARFEVRCPKCGHAGPRNCAARSHSNLGYSGHTVSVSRATPERAGWALTGVTRASLRERRREWMEENAADLLGAGLDHTALNVAEWIQSELNRRARAPERP
ncbi:replication initiator [Ruicaihuangia caeni]|uniref:replication initiator n=1 Tax=Ruicaihuangia caeni TaxID=3042517 RepID=UPI00338E16BD